MACTFQVLQRLPIDGAPLLLLEVCRTRFGALAFFLRSSDLLDGTPALAQAATREGALSRIDRAAAELAKLRRKMEGAA